jgi:uncharacterized phiE125 gp8 family phage protein
MGIKVITPASAEPIAVEVAYRHLRVGEAPADAALIALYLKAAREAAEKYTGITIAQATLELALDEFPGSEIELPRGVQSITSVIYIDADGNPQTIDPASYVLDDYSGSTWLLPADGYEWATPASFVNAVKIRFVAGYSDPTYPMPADLTIGILLTLGDLYEHRENTIVGASAVEIPAGARRFLDPYRVEWGV